VRTLDARAPPKRLVLDAGHGAPGNPGNTGVNGQAEGETMRLLADALAPALTSGGLAVTLTRPDAALVDYDRRVALAAGADLFLSLHSDARAGVTSGLDPRTGHWWTAGAAGFAVLWSDEGSAPLVDARLAWARALARRMVEAGFLAYHGDDYQGLYAPDAVPGVFVDRHAPGRRIRLLRRPTVPSLLVETHEAHDPEEVARWSEPATHAAFASAVLASIADLGASEPPPGSR